NYSNVLQLIEATPGKTDEDKTSMKRAAQRGEYAPKQTALFLNSDALREKLLPEQELKALASRADKTIAQLRPIVKQAKASQAAQEHKRDLDAIPALIEKCASPEATVRREAVQELGRIGDPQSAPVMIKLMKDTDETVRINAILALGWMQSKEAVPALIDAIKGKDLVMRRRAAQALGQIGDPRAVKPLIGIIGDKDCDVAVNASMSLGWLKAREAVPELLKIVTKLNRQEAYQRIRMLAAIQALGHIGDTAALPALEKWAKEAGDFPFSRRGNVKIANVYSTAQSLGLQGHAELAIAEIKAGGRSEIGVRQSDFLATKDQFYRLTRTFNALAGRPDTMKTTEKIEVFWPSLWEAGMTGIHMAWGLQDCDPAKYLQALTAASDLDLCWIDILPADGNAFGGKDFYSSSRLHSVEKPGAELILLKHRNEPAFQGFWWEELYPEVRMTPQEFEDWMNTRYGADYRRKLGLKADETVFDTDGRVLTECSGPLKTAYLRCAAEKLLASWRESQEWLHGLRKGCAFTYSISTAQLFKYPGLTAKAGAVIDVNGPESYQSFGRYNAFIMEMYKDGEARPAMSEFYNWYAPSPAHDIRGFAQHLMHGECFYVFAIHQLFEQGSTYDMWSWDASRWSNFKKIFQKARKIREYLAVPASAANVGLLCTDLTTLEFDSLKFLSASLPLRWDQHQAALWTALNQSQIPTDIIWTETMTPAKLARYRVLVLMDAKIVTDNQAQLIRNWVKDGGTLIAGGTTSLFDDSAALRKNYLLADIFGIDYMDNIGVADPAKIDTFCWERGGKKATALKAVSGLDPANFRNHVHRDIKPVKSLGIYKTTDKASAFLPEIAPGTSCEYDMPLGYDKVKPTSATALAAFANGDPALTINTVGKGLCYFWTPTYPGLCHVSSEWEMQSNKYDFWPNVRELLAAMVKGGLAYGKAALPVAVTGISKEIEVTVRQQPEHNRWMVHLLDYDPKSASVKSAAMTVYPPAGKAVKRIFYPDTDTEIKFAPADNGVAAQLRDFEVHDMLVIEF
ncbi:MAG: HEAT repeat domain-containing protein, partial [Kiritimatiellae bacterium]|nr:HEAT repeat domain-containing protein [Kiritimatiellia bacterium]